MIRRKTTPDKTVREEINLLLKLGFKYLGTNSAGHHLMEHPEYGRLRPMSSTPRNASRWRVTHRREVARLMGLTLWQWERLIVGQPLTRSDRPSRTSRRQRGDSSKALRVLASVDDRQEPGDDEAAAAATDVCRCGRKWLSDISPVGRRCPGCDGWVALS